MRLRQRGLRLFEFRGDDGLLRRQVRQFVLRRLQVRQGVFQQCGLGFDLIGLRRERQLRFVDLAGEIGQIALHARALRHGVVERFATVVELLAQLARRADGALQSLQLADQLLTRHFGTPQRLFALGAQIDRLHPEIQRDKPADGGDRHQRQRRRSRELASTPIHSDSFARPSPRDIGPVRLVAPRGNFHLGNFDIVNFELGNFDAIHELGASDEGLRGRWSRRRDRRL